ncbi:CD2-associated protein [Eucyclogobius newberryi]|uniref:CD2-associated protein n=1 Tax=Eucyclogobius newberryi TaxID=166745 RepID=UPI003B5CC88F
MDAVVEFDYEALHEDELTLRPGDVIKNVRCIEEDGWMEGELNGRRGLFPDNFVKEVKKDSKEAEETKNEARNEPKEEAPAPLREKSAGNVANLVNRMSAIGIPLGGFQPHPPAASKKPKRRLCKALFDYHPQNEDELELKVGDLIEVTEEVEEGWWSGTFNGKSGLFPSNFVKELDASAEDGESSEATPEETGMKDDGPASENASTPTSPPASLGNGAPRPPSKVMRVGFGDIFTGAHVKLKSVPSVPSAKSAHPNHPTPTPTEAPKVDAESRASLKRQSKEYCKVTFGFEATNEDELTLKEGEIIHVLSKDTGEPGWWRGEVGGREGVFPDNFVTMVNDADKDAGAMRGSLKTLKQDHEEKPRKPPPPSKQSVHKPEVPSADKKPHSSRTEDKVDKPMPEKHSKPAPLPPPKPTASGKVRPMSHPPKRPDKPLAPSASLRHNGEVPSTRSKPEPEPLPQLPVSKPRAPAAEVAEKPAEPDLMSFDDLTSASLKLSHPTVDRPKMPGKRPPTQFGAHTPNKEVNVEKSFFKMDEEDTSKPKSTEKPSSSTGPQSPSHLSRLIEAKPSPPAPGGTGEGPSPGVKGRLEPEDQSGGFEDLKTQMRELLLTVELLKAQQMKEILELRGELDEERHKRLALQMEIEKLKRTVHLT